MSSGKKEKLCSRPGCTSIGIHLCSGCGEEIYCSKDCQKEHWSCHKIACKSAVKPVTAAFQQSFDALSVKQLKNLLKAKAATMESNKRTTILDQLEKVVERNNLLWLVKQHVQPSEIEVLLTNSPPSIQPSQVEVPTNNVKGAKRKLVSKKNDTTAPNPGPTPQQLKEQASMIRKNPGLVRQSNPMFLKMSNAQILAYADYLDKAAVDPNMMKEIEKMSKLSSTERDQLQIIQEGLAGQKPLDNSWIATVVKALKSNPELIKGMLRGKGDAFGGVTDAQIEGFTDGVSRMNERVLTWILRALIYIGSLAKPATELYNRLNQYTYGQANFIISTLVLIILVFGSFLVYRFLRFVFLFQYNFFWRLKPLSHTAIDASTTHIGTEEVVTTAAAMTNLKFSQSAEELARELSRASSAESTEAEFEF